MLRYRNFARHLSLASRLPPDVDWRGKTRRRRGQVGSQTLRIEGPPVRQRRGVTGDHTPVGTRVWRGMLCSGRRRFIRGDRPACHQVSFGARGFDGVRTISSEDWLADVCIVPLLCTMYIHGWMMTTWYASALLMAASPHHGTIFKMPTCRQVLLARTCGHDDTSYRTRAPVRGSLRHAEREMVQSADVHCSSVSVALGERQLAI